MQLPDQLEVCYCCKNRMVSIWVSCMSFALDNFLVLATISAKIISLKSGNIYVCRDLRDSKLVAILMPPRPILNKESAVKRMSLFGLDCLQLDLLVHLPWSPSRVQAEEDLLTLLRRIWRGDCGLRKASVAPLLDRSSVPWLPFTPDCSETHMRVTQFFWLRITKERWQSRTSVK